MNESESRELIISRVKNLESGMKYHIRLKRRKILG